MKTALRQVIIGLWMLGAATAADAATERHILIDDCVVGGCSNQLCTDAAAGPVVSTCEFTPAYACYPKAGECKRQADGKCGWTQTDVLKACLANPPAEPGSKAPKAAAAPPTATIAKPK